MKPMVGDTRPQSTKSAKKGMAIVVAEIFNTVVDVLLVLSFTILLTSC
jgi:hypothetical protein